MQNTMIDIKHHAISSRSLAKLTWEHLFKIFTDEFGIPEHMHDWLCDYESLVKKFEIVLQGKTKNLKCYFEFCETGYTSCQSFLDYDHNIEVSWSFGDQFIVIKSYSEKEVEEIWRSLRPDQ